MLVTDPVLKYYREFPEKVFCRFIQQGKLLEITYRELVDKSLAYAERYRACNVKKGDPVIIILKHCPDQYYAFLGAMLYGCIPSFMPFPSVKQDPRIYWNSHEELFGRIKARVLVTYEAYEDAIRDNMGGLELSLVFPGQISPVRTGPDDLDISPKEVAFLQHSSGTTSLKKGVALSHEAVCEQICSYAQVLDFKADDCIATWLPLYHDMGLIACFILPMMQGVPLVSMDAFEWVADPTMLFASIEKYGCTHVWLPNFAFQHMVRTLPPDAKYDLGGMKAYINCSEPCKAETFDGFLKAMSSFGVVPEQLQVCYAMAETVFAATQTLPTKKVQVISVDRENLESTHNAVPPRGNSPVRQFVSVGHPIPGLEIMILDEKGAGLPEGEVGEIAATGKSLFSGYYRLLDETEKKFRKGWYFTGDLGFMKKGELFITGRKDDLIIVNGRNFYAHDIEFVVNLAPGVKPGRNVAVEVFNPEVGSGEVVVIVETERHDEPGSSNLKREIKQLLLSNYNLMVKGVELVRPGWLIKTTSGKISRKENVAKYIREKKAQKRPLFQAMEERTYELTGNTVANS